jgi:membrane associated rhomboid family serine protease
MLLLPIGHDESVRRFPWLTAGIMALCTVLQVQRTLFAPGEAELTQLRMERRRIEQQQAVEACDLSQGRPEDARACLEALHGGARAPGDAQKAALAEIDARERAHKSRDLVWRWGFVPARGFSMKLLTSIFVHGGWLHLLGNLLFLWLVGCNLEDRWGRAAFAGAFLLGGLVSALAFWLWHPHAETPLCGASGAISAVMGAFLVCFARTRIRIWYLYFFGLLRTGTFRIAAYWAFPFWFLEQAFNAWFESYGPAEVAYSAHVGGFLFGLGGALLLRVSGAEQRWLLPRTAEKPAWEEDPAMVQAFDAVAQGKKPEALALLRGLLERRPDHAAARHEMCRLGIELGDAQAVRATAATLIAELARHRKAEALDVFRQVEKALPAVPLSDRAVADVVRCAVDTGDAEAAVMATRRMVREHPGSPLLPRALWDTALAQEKSGRVDLAKKTLEHLASRFSLDPIGDQARRKLAALK